VKETTARKTLMEILLYITYYIL